MEPKSYQFGYAVRDYASGNDFGRHESSDGDTVHGEYRVQLPDGRTQIVTYTADWQNGFQANVKYEGEAIYPERHNAYGNDFGGNHNTHGYSGANYGGYRRGGSTHDSYTNHGHGTYSKGHGGYRK